jgi:type IV pilus assembly protein PilF
VTDPRIDGRCGAAGILLAVLLAGCAGSPSRSPEATAEELAQLNLQLGIAYMQEGNFDLAVNRLRKAVTAQPQSSDAHLSLAVLYDRLGQDDAADLHYRETLRLQPDSPRAHVNYGSFLCRRDQVAEAEQHFQLAAQDRGYENPELALTNAGLCMRSSGDLAKAEDYLRRGLEVAPRLPAALLAMGEVQFDTGRHEPARAYLQRYEEVGPPTPGSLWLGYQVERQLGNGKAAATYARELTGRYPDSSEAGRLNARPPR